MNDGLDTFQSNRGRLLGIAYRMLGDMSQAEDVVQDAWLRWQKIDTSEIRDARAWLSAVTIRLALDSLRAQRARREHYVGPWLPEPILPDDLRLIAAEDVERSTELASDLSLALLHVLERLSPDERAALILHDAFDSDYSEIAAILGKSEAACRKLVSRARERAKAGPARFQTSREKHRDLLMRFAQASASANASELANLLATDAVAYTDGGGQVSAALNPIYGVEKVIRFITSLSKKLALRGTPQISLEEINGEPGLVLTLDGELFGIVTIATAEGRIADVYVLRNPEKLTRVARWLSRHARGSSPPA